MPGSSRRSEGWWKHLWAHGPRIRHDLYIKVRQWWWLTHRYWALKKEDRWYLGFLILQPFAVGMLLILVFHSQDPYSVQLMFVIAISALWFGAFSSIREIVSEKPMYQRERRIGLKIFAYVLSKIPVLSIICLIQCLILQLMLCLMVVIDSQIGLVGNILRVTSMFSIMFLTALVGIALGLMLSALSILLGEKAADRSGMTSSEVAMSLIPLALLPQVILGGPFTNLRDASWVIRFGSNLMVSRWTLKALLKLRKIYLLSYMERTKYSRLLIELNMHEGSAIRSCAVICIFWIFLVILTMFFLKMHEVDTESIKRTYRKSSRKTSS